MHCEANNVVHWELALGALVPPFASSDIEPTLITLDGLLESLVAVTGMQASAVTSDLVVLRGGDDCDRWTPGQRWREHAELLGNLQLQGIKRLRCEVDGIIRWEHPLDALWSTEPRSD